jgi:hypothetical protein
MPEQSNDYRVVTFGSGGVGKSSLGKNAKSLCVQSPNCPQHVDRPHTATSLAHFLCTARVHTKNFLALCVCRMLSDIWRGSNGKTHTHTRVPRPRDRPESASREKEKHVLFIVIRTTLAFNDLNFHHNAKIYGCTFERV